MALRNTGQNGGVTGADIGASRGWETTTGTRETIVAVIDTVKMHALQRRMKEKELWAEILQKYFVSK